MRYFLIPLIVFCYCACVFGQSCFNAGNGSDGVYNATSNTTIAGGTYNFTSFSISPGVTVTATGNEPLVILVTGNVNIQGTLSVKGGNGANGIVNITYGGGGIGVAGGSNGGDGSYNNFNWSASASWGYGIGGGGGGQDFGGGGGGGYGTNGAASGNSTGGQAGATYGDAQISVLQGGSGGGGGSGGFSSGGGGGGAGGGAIEISCGGSVTIASGAIINANGGNGGNAGTHVGGGGGGSGGSILIKSVQVINNGLITAVGGTGGTSQSFLTGRFGGNGGNGRITIDHEIPITGTGTYNPAIGSEQPLLIQPLVQAIALPDTEVCEGNQVMLFADGNASSYIWTNGVSDSVAFTPVNGGWYIVTASSGGSCIAKDSIFLIIASSPAVSPYAIPGTSLCEGETVTLFGGGNDVNYTWSDGIEDGTAFIPVNSGTYNVTATNASSCTAIASIEITVHDNPIVDLGVDIEASSFPVTLDAGAGFTDYQWSTGDETQTISVDFSGEYAVTVSDVNGCSATDSIEVNLINGIDKSVNRGIKIYPIPAVDLIYLDTEQYIRALQIRNSVGVVIREITHPQKTIYIANLSQGIYFVDIVLDEKILNLWFIKQ